MEPTVKALAGNSPSLVFKRYFLATRPMFMTASVVPVILGTTRGASIAGALDWTAFGLAMLAVVLVHGAVNVLNDVWDDASGTDRVNGERIFPYTGGSRFIQNQVLTATQMRRWGYLLMAAATVTGLLLFVYKGPLVIAFGLAGISAGIFYSMPPVQLAARGVGEIAVGIGFGVLPVTGAAWLQSGILDWPTLLLSLPVSIWVANILLINGVPDARADAVSGKRTLATRLGTTGTGVVYALSSLAAFMFTALTIVVPGHSPWSLTLPLVLLCAGLYVGFGVYRSLQTGQLKSLIELTLAIHTIGTLWLAVWVWVG